MVFLIILIILLVLYLSLILAPAIAMFHGVFRRKDRARLWESDLSETSFAPFEKEMRDSYAYLKTLPMEQVTIRSEDGLKLYGEYYNGGFSATAICYHGYGSSPYHLFSPQAKELYTLGFNLLFPVARGHNESEGKFTTLGILEARDLMLWIDWAAKRDECKDILLYGISMGCTAIEYASDSFTQEKIRAMVLDCGFTSPWDQLTFEAKKHRVPGKIFLPYLAFFARCILKIDLKKSTVDSLKGAKTPALFLHGEADHTVPIAQGEANFETCASQKSMIRVPGAGHTLAYLRGGETCRAALDAFLNQHFTLTKTKGN